MLCLGSTSLLRQSIVAVYCDCRKYAIKPCPTSARHSTWIRYIPFHGGEIHEGGQWASPASEFQSQGKSLPVFSVGPYKETYTRRVGQGKGQDRGILSTPHPLHSPSHCPSPQQKNTCIKLQSPFIFLSVFLPEGFRRQKHSKLSRAQTESPEYNHVEKWLQCQVVCHQEVPISAPPENQQGGF